MTDRKPLTTQQLDDIETRVTAATPGPWIANTRIGVVTDATGQPLAVFGGGDQDRADAVFVAHAPEDVRALLAEIRRLHTRVWELERPAVEAQRAKVRASFTELITAATEDRDYEGAFDVECLLREREEQWASEDAAARPAVVESHVVADDSSDPEHIDDCPGCEAVRRVQCNDCGAVGEVFTGDDGLAYLDPSGQIGHGASVPADAEMGEQIRVGEIEGAQR